MNKMTRLLFACLLAGTLSVSGQNQVDSIKFFTDPGIVDITLTTDIGKLQIPESIEVYQEADIAVRFPDNTSIIEKMKLHARGKSRRINCSMPPIMLDFHTPTSPRLYPLSRLKLVVGCANSGVDEQLLLKEYMVYKIYNLLEEKSFRARLARVTYNDSKGKMKSYTQYAFLLEDVDDMAKRNGCKASKKVAFAVDEADPALMNKVDIFEYMIGNTDWSVPANHNIKMIYPRNDETAKVLTVPYDFDNSGLVNAYYAIPSDIVGTASVTQRVYRGFKRTMPEIQHTLALFREKRESINALINGFDLFKDKTKKDIIDYLDEFYKTIASEKKVRSVFIDNARDR